MKGIIIVSNENLERCPEVEDSLIPFCERIKQEGDNSLFHSKEGTMMTMICILLEKEVKYSLNFQNQEVPSKSKQGLKVASKQSKIAQN